MPKPTNQKEALIKAALKLFGKNGYASTPVSLIAKTAGVSQGLLYNFFASKEDLLKEIMRLGFRDIQLSMATYASSTDPKASITLHVRKTIEIVKENRALWKLLHSLRLQEKVATTMQKQFRVVVQSAVQTFQQAFKNLGIAHPDMEALLFLSQIDGMVILYLQDPETPIDEMGKLLIKRYIK